MRYYSSMPGETPARRLELLLRGSKASPPVLGTPAEYSLAAPKHFHTCDATICFFWLVNPGRRAETKRKDVLELADKSDIAIVNRIELHFSVMEPVRGLRESGYEEHFPGGG